jgi:hypothetical protein
MTKGVTTITVIKEAKNARTACVFINNHLNFA